MIWIVKNLWLIPALPLVAAGLIAVSTQPQRKRAAALAIGSMVGAFLLSVCAFAATLGGSCHSPIAAHATLADGTITVRGFIGAPDGSETYRDELSGLAAQADALGRELARRMQAAGAETLLERLRQEAAAAT